MLAFIIRRLLQAVLVMAVMSGLVFVGLYVVGDPVSMMASAEATDLERDEIRANFGLDKPLWQQYFIFMSHALQLDFGKSFLTGQSAMGLILERMPATLERLRASLGRPPTPDELAEELGCTPDDVIDALDAGSAYRSASTDTPEGSHAASMARMGTESGIGNDERVMLEQLLMKLPDRQRKIVWLRFFEDLSQSEIAAIVGTSQVHVSRLLREALRELRMSAGPTE